METGPVKDSHKVQEDFNSAVQPSRNKPFYWRYGAYNIYLSIRNFFLGEKKPKKNDNKFADMAETLLSTISDKSDLELLSTSEKLLSQQRMLEDTRARRRLEKWATRVIAYYLLLVFLLILTNGAVLIFHPVETIELIGGGNILVKRGFISDSIMTVILTTTTINIIGLGVIVLKGHFDRARTEK